MPKIHKEIHVHIPCPACGKTERVKLKWAQKHKSMKCGGCKESVGLKANPARSLIARTAELVAAFEKTLEALHTEAKSFKAKKKTAKKTKAKQTKAKQTKGKQKSKPHKTAAKKRSSRKAPVVTPLLPEPGVGAEFTV
jgi:hypothetical protein